MTEVYAALFAPIVMMWVGIMVLERVTTVFVRVAQFIRKSL